MNATVPDPKALASMMSDLRWAFASDEARIAAGLPALLDAFRGSAFDGARGAGRVRAPRPAAIGALMADLRAPVDSLEASGLLSNPWTAAALRRDELRHASVLRWLLDPRGGHGCGGAVLAGFLDLVAAGLSGGFPRRPSVGCSVSVEQCPDGDLASRVDIQVDDPTFFMLIEVKIDAPEQDCQLDRYCDIAAARTGGARPFAVIYLTVDGRQTATAGDHAARVVAISWSRVAATLRAASRGLGTIPGFLATSFANHIRNL